MAPAAAVDAGRVVVAWFTLAGDRPSVRVAFSSDGGVTFAAPIDVDARAPLGRVDVAVHGGEAIVSWMASAGEDAVLLARRVDSDGRMGETLSIAPMRPDRASGFPRMELAGDQLGFVWTDTDARLRAARLAVADLPAPRQGEGPASSPGAGPRVGSPMPAFAAVTLSGEPVTLGAGQVSLVNVWATWCEPCRQELPVLVELHRRHAGLHVVGVSVDRARSSQELVDFVARRKIPFEIWHDRDGPDLAAPRHPGASGDPARRPERPRRLAQGRRGQRRRSGARARHPGRDRAAMIQRGSRGRCRRRGRLHAVAGLGARRRPSSGVGWEQASPP
jgi:thiol-disulfide isomerase/thioredoxin